MSQQLHIFKSEWFFHILQNHQLSSIINHPSSIIHHPSSIINHQSSIINHQSSIINHHHHHHQVFRWPSLFPSAVFSLRMKTWRCPFVGQFVKGLCFVASWLFDLEPLLLWKFSLERSFLKSQWKRFWQDNGMWMFDYFCECHMFNKRALWSP